MKHYQNDPRKMVCRFGSFCNKCKTQIKKGEPIIYWPSDKSAMHEKCGESDFARFLETAQDEDNYSLS